MYLSMLGKPVNRTESDSLVRARMGIYIALATLSLLLNGSFLVVLCKSWNLMKQRRITYHVTNLALSDALVGASSLGHFVAGKNKVGSALVVCAWAAILTSLLAVCMMAIERALVIKKPHRWNKILPLKRVFLVMLGNWCTTLTLAILMYFYTLTMRFVLLILFYVPITITSLMYFYVYKQMCKKRLISSPDSASSQVEHSKHNLYQKKLCWFVCLLMAVLLITVSPSFLILAVKNACELFKLQCEFMATVTHLSYYFYMLEITNFVVNPVIYIWRMGIYRRAFWRLFGRNTMIHGRTNHGHPSM